MSSEENQSKTVDDTKPEDDNGKKTDESKQDNEANGEQTEEDGDTTMLSNQMSSFSEMATEDVDMETDSPSKYEMVHRRESSLSIVTEHEQANLDNEASTKNLQWGDSNDKSIGGYESSKSEEPTATQNGYDIWIRPDSAGFSSVKSLSERASKTPGQDSRRFSPDDVSNIEASGQNENLTTDVTVPAEENDNERHHAVDHSEQIQIQPGERNNTTPEHSRVSSPKTPQSPDTVIKPPEGNYDNSFDNGRRYQAEVDEHLVHEADKTTHLVSVGKDDLSENDSSEKNTRDADENKENLQTEYSERNTPSHVVQTEDTNERNAYEESPEPNRPPESTSFVDRVSLKQVSSDEENSQNLSKGQTDMVLDQNIVRKEENVAAVTESSENNSEENLSTYNKDLEEVQAEKIRSDNSEDHGNEADDELDEHDNVDEDSDGHLSHTDDDSSSSDSSSDSSSSSSSSTSSSSDSSRSRSRESGKTSQSAKSTNPRTESEKTLSDYELVEMGKKPSSRPHSGRSSGSRISKSASVERSDQEEREMEEAEPHDGNATNSDGDTSDKHVVVVPSGNDQDHHNEELHLRDQDRDSPFEGTKSKDGGDISIRDSQTITEERHDIVRDSNENLRPGSFKEETGNSPQTPSRHSRSSPSCDDKSPEEDSLVAEDQGSTNSRKQSVQSSEIETQPRDDELDRKSKTKEGLIRIWGRKESSSSSGSSTDSSHGVERTENTQQSMEVKSVAEQRQNDEEREAEEYEKYMEDEQFESESLTSAERRSVKSRHVLTRQEGSRNTPRQAMTREDTTHSSPRDTRAYVLRCKAVSARREKHERQLAMMEATPSPIRQRTISPRRSASPRRTPRSPRRTPRSRPQTTTTGKVDARKEKRPNSERTPRSRQRAKSARPATTTGKSDNQDGRSKQQEFFKVELKRLEKSLTREASKIEKPPVKNYYPYVFNSLEPYYNTHTAKYLIYLPDEVRHGYVSRSTAGGLIDPWEDLRMDRTVLPRIDSRPVTRADAKGQRNQSEDKRPPKEGSTRLPKYPVVKMETKGLTNKQLYFSDVPMLREELKQKYSANAKEKIDADYERTKQDYYRMELDKMEEIHPLNRPHMRKAYFAYLQNTPGSKKAIYSCVKKSEKAN